MWRERAGLPSTGLALLWERYLFSPKHSAVLGQKTNIIFFFFVSKIDLSTLRSKLNIVFCLLSSINKHDSISFLGRASNMNQALA